MNKKYYLNNNWQFRLTDVPAPESALKESLTDKWYPAEVPGTLHTDLFRSGLIEDPFKEQNEFKLEWISRSGCIYRTEFNYPGPVNRNSNIKLVLEGLDTTAEIYLNSKLAGKADNMFLKYEFNAAPLLVHGNNILEVHFTSPVEYSKKTEKRYGRLYAALTSYRVYIRKAQYSFGWDWGPSYPTMGIWRQVYLLEEGKAAIRSIQFNTDKLFTNRAILNINFDITTSTREELKGIISLKNAEQEFTKEIKIDGQDNYKIKLKVPDPKLWWPNGEGEQNLYELSIRVVDQSGNVLDEKTKKVGIRTTELQLRAKGRSTFRFVVNKRPIYAKGMNWIPGDSFLPRVTKEKYRKLLTYARTANANMIRVWGGGIYEDDEFYNLCDELGLLVWQDFMFACAAYPEHKQFLKSVTKEIIQNVERLCNHPCIAIWCGNNENEWIWQQSKHSSYKKMPGYKIFHKLLPKLMNELDPGRPYWPTSPFGFDNDPNSQTSGNRHQWNIWSNWVDYSKAENDNSLFVTEFGFQGPANIDTLNKYIPAPKRKVQSDTFEYYNKQIDGPERIIRFLAAHLPLSLEWEDFIYLAQLNQGLALSKCIGHWRTNGGVTNGSIIWQLNDTWPVTSWSLIDYELNPKMGYYFVKNIFSKSILYFSKTDKGLNINLLDEGSRLEGKIKIIVIDLSNGQYLYESFEDINTKGNKYSTLHSLQLNELPEHKNWIIISTLYNSQENILHRNYYLEKEWKHTELPEPGISSTINKSADSVYLSISAKMPAFFVDPYHPGAVFSDRGFTLLPGEEKIIEILNMKDSEIRESDIKIFSLNNYLLNK